MFDTRMPGSGSGSTTPAADEIGPDSSAVLGAADPASRAAVPLERLEAQICELAAARIQRRLTWRTEEDGSLAGTFRLPPLQGAVLLKALRAAIGDLEHPHDNEGPGVSTETPGARQPGAPTSSSLADGLLVIAEAFLADKVARADDPDVYQVIVHIGTAATTDPASTAATTVPAPAAASPAAPASPAGVSAETSEPPARALGHPADPARCHVEDGPAISVGTAQMLACSAALSWMLHDSAGKLLDLGRRRRRPNATLRRAARERDNCRCRFPGCESRRVDLHHIQYWSHGGRTTLDNIVSLCKYHHMLVHDRGYLIAARRDGTFAFYGPDGAAIPRSPALLEADGTIEGCHDADISPDTIIPPWYGERLDLDHAIYVCLANAANQARHPEQPEVQYDPEEEYEPFQPRMGVAHPLDWIVKQGREHAVA